MSNTLFPEPAPEATTAEPPVWIRRLVLVRSLEPAPDIIRDIPFGLGLNLVVTRQPSQDSKEALGHDVGKTLLTRLMRYLLGEARFADGRTRGAIRAALPDSLVAGEFRVAGQDWAVIRPLGAPSTFLPRAAQTQSWLDLLTRPGADAEFAAFVERVIDAVLAPISSPLLTHARRPAAWMDVLAWIARDQKCRYGHPLVWRHAESDSGTTALHTEDASTVLRSTCGLMDNREKRLFEQHDELLQRRQRASQDKALLERHSDAERESLERDLRDLLKTEEIGISEIELQAVRGRADRQRLLRADEVAKLGLSRIRAERDESQQVLANALADERSFQRQLQAARQHLEQRRARPRTIHEQMATLCDKQLDDCPLKLKIANQQVPSPDVEDIQQLEGEVTGWQRELDAVRASLDGLRARAKAGAESLAAAELRLAEVTAGIDGLIALYEAMAARVERFIGRPTQAARLERELEELNRDIDSSLKQQSDLRDALAESRAWLPARFTDLCKELLGSTREFAVLIESKAIRLQIVGASGTPGEATSTSALVLCLDLAALRAAMDGYGHHPRFMILDSPREADMEIGIFNRLVERLVAWHADSGASPFQLIVTTTTRPLEAQVPKELIRVELAREPHAMLLLGVDL
jgi:hypothetical protein